MSLEKMTKEELELLSYKDIAYLVLKEGNGSLNTQDLFRKVCDLLGFTDKEYAEKIGDFYTTLTIDKRFALLEGAEWDLRERRSVPISIDEEEGLEEELEEEIEEELEEEEDLIEEDGYDDEDVELDEDLDDTDDDLMDLTIVADEELEEE